ncbi:MAG: HAD-IB family hydrolase [Tissierellia bacterium]|nr:HAD-IB family hydrolase [Tissierellia bacterium]
MKKTAAFFDIDGTIYRDSLMTEHFRKLVQYEVIDNTIWMSDVKKVYDEWEKRHGDYEEYLETIAEVYRSQLKGVDRDFICYIADHVIKDKSDNIYKYSRYKINWHKEREHLIFFISGSPDFLVSRMARRYDVTDYRGSIYVVNEDNQLTGEIKRMWDSESKTKALKELIELYDVDLNKSFAYGDTKGDLSMLKMVGNPIAINPNMALLKAIKLDEKLIECAKIVVERKNVIYSLDPSVNYLEI